MIGRFQLVLYISAALLLIFTGCDDDENVLPSGEEPLGGSPTYMSTAGNTFDITLGEGLEGLSNTSATVTDFENGVSTINGGVDIENPLAAQLASLVAEKYPQQVSMNGQNLSVEAKVINTDEGIARVQPNGEVFNMIKYDAEIGTVFTHTINGVTTERTVIGKSSLSDFFPDETGPNAELQVIVVEETKEDYPMLEKLRYYSNEERGLVRVAAHLTNGEVKYIDVNSALLNIVLGDATLPEAVFNPDVDYGEVSDIDGNTYRTVMISGKNWMAENLRTKQLNDGTAIPPGDSSSVSDEPGYYEFVPQRGTFYNGATVVTGKLCPEGWHVPTMEEWRDLADAYGDVVDGIYNDEAFRTDAGYDLASTIDWWGDYAEENTNASGFSLVPLGSDVFGDEDVGTDNWGYDSDGLGTFDFEPYDPQPANNTSYYESFVNIEYATTCRCIQD